METLKNILNPGKGKDDEVLYGSGQHAPGKGFSGEGSHLAKETSAAEPTTFSATGEESSATGHAPSTQEPLDTSAPRVGSSTTGHSTSAPTSNNAPLGGSTATQAGTSGQRLDDNASMASIKSGVHGTGQTGKSTEPPAVPGELNINKALPPAPESGATTETGTGESTLPDRSLNEPSNPSTGTAAIGRTSTDRSFPLGSGSSTSTHLGTNTHPAATTSTSATNPSDTRTSAGGQPAGLTGTSTSGPEYSSTTNPAPMAGTSHTSRDAALGAGAVGAAGAGAATLQHHHEEADQVGAKDIPTGTAPSQYAPEGGKGIGGTLRQGPHSTFAGNAFDPALYDKDGKLLSSTEGSHGASSGLSTGTGPTSTVDPGTTSAATGHTSSADRTDAGAGTTGPHSSKLLNKLDPRVDSDRDGSKTIGGAQAGTQQTSTTTEPSSTSTGIASGGIDETSQDKKNPYSATALDPRVDSHPHSTTSETGTTTKDSHLGRDAAVVGGGSGLAAGAYEADKHHHHEPTSTTGASTSTSTKDSHLGRDAAIVGGGSGLAAGAYEADKHHHHEPTSTTGASTSTSTKDSHLGRDAAVVGGGTGLAAGAYSAEKHHHEPTSTSGVSTSTTGHNDALGESTTTGKPTGPDSGSSSTATPGPHKSSLLNKLDPRVHSGKDKSKTVEDAPVSSDTSTGVPPSGTTSSTTGAAGAHEDHRSRDAAIAGTGAGLGAGAGAGAYESRKQSARTEPTATSASTVPSAAGPHSSDVADQADPKVHSDHSAAHGTQHHTGRDTAIVGGTAAAGGATAVHEHDKHAAEKAEKEHLKESEKEQKAAKKEEKAAQKAHDKEGEHQEHDHEKSEKKHHSLLGFLHRDKTHKDDGQKEAENAAIQKNLEENFGAGHSHHTTHTEHSHGERNRLHKEPPPAIKAQQERMVTEPTTGLPMDPKLGSGQGGTDGAPIEGISQDHPGSSTTGIGADHETSTITGTGPHSTSVEDKLDPRVSDRDAVATGHGASGPASSTADTAASTRDPGTTDPSVLESETGVEGAHGSKGGSGHY